jgi:hypothetical protein
MRVTDVVRETKDISSFLSGQSPMVTLPPGSARAKIFTPQDRQAIERFVPAVRDMTDHDALESAKKFLETFLNRIKTGEQLDRTDLRIVGGLYDIIRKQTDGYDTFMRKYNLDESQ